jgi:ADP-ribosylation factor GTPase-activating protein 2/3
MYFGRNDYDPHVVNEAQTRLQSFQGASSISSNQYFGREEEEEDLGGPRSTEGLLGDGSLSGLEFAARDAYARLLANPDVQNMGDNIRTGALKVCIPSLVFGHIPYPSGSYLTILPQCPNDERGESDILHLA